MVVVVVVVVSTVGTSVGDSTAATVGAGDSTAATVGAGESVNDSFPGKRVKFESKSVKLNTVGASEIVGGRVGLAVDPKVGLDVGLDVGPTVGLDDSPKDGLVDGPRLGAIDACEGFGVATVGDVDTSKLAAKFDP